jgi:hypothetical protein
MSDRVLPALGSIGTYVLAPPFNTKILPEELYTCKAIRSIGEYISYNQDPKKEIYDYYGLTQADYEEDIKNDMEIISLQNQEGVWLYVPARFILKYPIVNGIPYHQVALVCKLPAIEVGKNLTNVTVDMNNLLKDYLGVDSIIDIVETSRIIAVTREAADALELERTALIEGKVTDRARYKKVEQELAGALAKIADLEYYIENRYFGYISPTTDFVATPKILTPAAHSVGLGPSLTATTKPYFTSPYGPSDENDTHVSTDWQIAYDPEFTNIYIESMADTVNLGTWTVNNLPVNENLYLRVRFTSEHIGNSHWSSIVVFNTKTSYIVTPDIASPVDAATGIDSTVTITTTAFVSSLLTDTHVSTDWQIASDIAFTNIVAQSLLDTTNKTTWVANGLLANTQYYVRARFKSSAGYISEWSPISSFTTKSSFDTKPVKPIIIVPVNNVNDIGPSITIQGNAFKVNTGVDTHVSTDWDIASDINFTTIVYQSHDDITNKTLKTFTNTPTVVIPPNSTLYIRIRYKGTTTGLSDWSDTITMHTKASYSSKPNTPTVISPTDGTNDLGPNITLKTSAFAVDSGVDVHISSDWQASLNGTFTQIIASSINDTVNLTSWDIGLLPPNKTIFLRVRYKGSVTGYSDWMTSVHIFTKLYYQNRPIIGSPANNQDDLGPIVSFTSSQFSSIVPGDTHISSDWQLAHDNNFTALVNRVTDDKDNKTSWSSDFILNGSSYYIRVRYKGSLSGYSNWSLPIKFITKFNYIDKPTISIPLTGTDNLGPSVSFVSSPYKAAGTGNRHTSSDWQISTDPNFAYIQKESLFDNDDLTTWAADIILPATTFYARVRYRGLNNITSEWSNPISFNTKLEFINTPTIISPANNAIDQGPMVSLVASELSMATGAETHISSDWQIATDPIFNTIVSNTSNDSINKISWISDQLAPNTDYYARVRYKGKRYGTTSWSTRIKFTTRSEYTMRPTILIPTNGAIEIGPFVTITSSEYKAAPGGNTHNSSSWEIASDAGFANILYSNYANVTDKTQWSINTVLPVNTTLYVRVKYHGSIQTSEWSPISVMTTKSEYIKTPVLIKPLDGSNNESTSTSLKVKPFESLVPGELHFATSWEISTDATFGDVTKIVQSAYGVTAVSGNVTKMEMQVTGLPADTQLYARAMFTGSISSDSKWSSIISFKTIDNSINASGLYINTPANGGIEYTWPNVTFTSTLYSSADPSNTQVSALWEIYEYSNPGSPFKSETITSAPFNIWTVDLSTVSGVSKGNTFYVRVKYFGVAGESDWNVGVYSLTVQDPILVGIQKPTITQPLDVSINNVILTQPITVTSTPFVSSDITETHQQSVWQVAEDAAFTINVGDETTAVDLTNYSLTGLPNVLTYWYLRVKYIGSVNESPWSDPIRIKVI